MGEVDLVPVTATGPAPESEAVLASADGRRTIRLDGGRIVPYPEPTSPAATKIGKANKRSDTLPEMRLRSALHRRGHRFRKDHLVRAGKIRTHPDIVFSRLRLAVFVDGCFWHSCPEHGQTPKRNRAYWVPKLAANVNRDRRTDRALAEDGWLVLRIWEHTDLPDAVAQVESAVQSRRRLP